MANKMVWIGKHRVSINEIASIDEEVTADTEAITVLLKDGTVHRTSDFKQVKAIERAVKEHNQT